MRAKHPTAPSRGRRLPGIISRVKKNTSIPVGLKLSPTLEPLEAFITTCIDAGLDFITAHNSPGGIVIDVVNEVPFGAPAVGGYVMGRAFLPYSLGRIVRIRHVANIPVIGVGGIYEAHDALQYLLCDCPLVGMGSAMYFEGPKILDTLHAGISDWMQTKGYAAVSEFQGKALRHIKNPGSLKSEPNFVLFHRFRPQNRLFSGVGPRKFNGLHRLR